MPRVREAHPATHISLSVAQLHKATRCFIAANVLMYDATFPHSYHSFRVDVHLKYISVHNYILDV